MGSVLRHGTQRSWGRRGWLGPGVRGHPDLRGRHRDTSLALSRLHPVTAARRAQRLPSSPCPWPGLGHRPRSGSVKPPGRHRVSTEAGRRGHERQQHRHLPAAKVELVTAMARERRRDTGRRPDVPERQECPDPTYRRAPGASGVGRAPLGRVVSCLRSSYLGILTAARRPLSLILK